MPKIFPLPCQTGTTDSPFPQKFSELIRIPSDNIFGITQEHQLFSRIINHLFMKKETEFEPALRQVISQTFIDTPAPRKTRYRIIHPDLNTLKNAEDNLSIILCVSERKTRLDSRPQPWQGCALKPPKRYAFRGNQLIYFLLRRFSRMCFTMFFALVKRMVKHLRLSTGL